MLLHLDRIYKRGGLQNIHFKCLSDELMFFVVVVVVVFIVNIYTTREKTVFKVKFHFTHKQISSIYLIYNKPLQERSYKVIAIRKLFLNCRYR
jgi:hypothetical protein